MRFSVHHTAISAVDMDESIRFYGELGFEVALRHRDPAGEFEIAHLKLDGTFLEIFWYRSRQDAPATAGALATDLPRVGVKHLGLRVGSIREAKEFLERRGLASGIEVREGVTGVTYFFVKDPSGILLEFVQDDRGL
ncbi:VOC family protein [Saccharothrix syringae]|uniref:Glyoxalase/bleomycin resistance/dioxygenase family protein n=1 Tax=Saccharothrix syringae TaxID=103733 RepID=A0A5Q0H0B2_SACSY|nr:VOC family protein [Saccharothrix syringae]QFZ19294.1 glyoxalase/bleomycin resistance/dioxygenase family protein [Saccharothrix syringae]